MADRANRPGDAEFPDRVEWVRKSFAARNVDGYRAAVRLLSEEARSLDELTLARRITRLARLREKRADGEYDGLEPVVGAYLSQLNRNADRVDPELLRELRKNPDLRSAFFDRSPLPMAGDTPYCVRFWQAWARQGPDGLPPGAEAGLHQCLVGEPTYDEHPLTDPLVLPPVDACSEFVYVFVPPGDVPQGFQAQILPGLPMGGVVYLGTDGQRVAIYTQATFRVPINARTQQFTLRLTGAGQDHDFAVTLPVRLAIHRDCEPGFDRLEWNFAPGADVSIVVTGSGPAGDFHWSWIPTAGAGLPAGLVLEDERDLGGALTGRAWIHGRVREGARTAVGLLRLAHGTDHVDRVAVIWVPVHVTAADRADLSRLRDVTRGEAVRIRLPDLHGGGGDPARYSWSVEPGWALPDGLAVAHRDGAWWVEGAVAATARVETRRTRLRMGGGPGELGGYVELGLRVGLTFRVYTQNCRLFPDDYIPTAALVGLCLWGGPLNPGCAIPTAIEALWDGGIPNTDEDNEQRADCLIDRIGRPSYQPGTRVRERVPYDVVALQEVWEGPFTDGVRDRIAAGAQSLGYAALDGPGPAGFEISSGLLLLVHNRLTAPASEHHARVFNAAPDLKAAIGDGNFDGVSQKGFTVSTVRFGPDPDEFFLVVNTHLQADGRGRDESDVRGRQFDEIRAFLDARPGTHPAVLLGDFNVPFDGNPGTPANQRYQDFLARLGGPVDVFAAGGPYDTDDNQRNAYAYHWAEERPARPPAVSQRLDYVLVRQGAQFGLTPELKRMEDDECVTYLCRDPRTVPASGWLIGTVPVSGMQCYLSDHFGLSAILRLVRT